MKDKTLLIMAAGMGSRFGGLKQIEPMGPNGEFLIDYSIYDAIKEGFTKVVFVIKRENFDLFKETVGNRVSKHIKCEYAFQDLTDVPNWFEVPEERVKPWGTTHAILQAKDLIKEPFAIINADDFYGRDAYKTISNFLDTNDEYDYCTVGYIVDNTLSEHGSVKRGVCIRENDKLVELIESNIIKKDENILATPLEEGNTIILKDEDLVSMNMLGFTKTLFPIIEKEFDEFLKTNGHGLTSELLIPITLQKLNKNKIANVFVLKTSSSWYGITYKEDKEKVVEAINKMIEEGIYPENLWED